MNTTKSTAVTAVFYAIAAAVGEIVMASTKKSPWENARAVWLKPRSYSL